MAAAKRRAWCFLVETPSPTCMLLTKTKLAKLMQSMAKCRATPPKTPHTARNEPAFWPQQTNILVRRTSEKAKSKKTSIVKPATATPQMKQFVTAISSLRLQAKSKLQEGSFPPTYSLT